MGDDSAAQQSIVPNGPAARMKQFFKNHPKTTKAALWTGGALTASAAVAGGLSYFGDDKVRDLPPEDTTEEEPMSVAPAQAPARQQVKPLTYGQKRYKDYIER